MTSEDVQPLDTEKIGTTPDVFEDVKYYPVLKVDRLYAGFPIFTSTPTYIARQGETVVVDTGSARQICSYLNGTWRCASLGGVTANGSFFTKNTSSTTTTVIPHGLGRTPSLFKIFSGGGGSSVISEGYYNGTTQACYYDASGANGASDSSHAIVAGDNTGNFISGTVTWDDTNVTITWAKTNAPSVIAFFMWSAQ